MRRILVLLALIAILPFQAFAEESENLLRSGRLVYRRMVHRSEHFIFRNGGKWL